MKKNCKASCRGDHLNQKKCFQREKNQEVYTRDQEEGSKQKGMMILVVLSGMLYDRRESFKQKLIVSNTLNPRRMQVNNKIIR